VVWQSLDGMTDIGLEGAQGLPQFGFGHQASDVMIAGRLLSLSEHDLHPAVDTEKVVAVLVGMSMIAEEVDAFRQ
jgi:hypothetical protein